VSAPQGTVYVVAFRGAPAGPAWWTGSRRLAGMELWTGPEKAARLTFDKAVEGASWLRKVVRPNIRVCVELAEQSTYDEARCACCSGDLDSGHWCSRCVAESTTTGPHTPTLEGF